MASAGGQAGATRDFVLKKAAFFRDVNLWPRNELLAPDRWLSNFSGDEVPLALQLLNAFQYFSQDLTDELFVAAFHSISAHLWTRLGASAPRAWTSFCDRVIVTPVEGEKPNPTDSGYAFARRARQLLGIDEGRIGKPPAVVAFLMAANAPVVFVDDFVGSGDQFIATWVRPYQVGTTVLSFQAIAKVRGGDFYYCPLVCTEYGADRIRRQCPEVVVAPAHLISPADGALAPNSRIWPPPMLARGAAFVRDASARAGIPAAGQGAWQGYHGLGLALAFAHGVPDATLPLFYWEKNGWNPLLRRT